MSARVLLFELRYQLRQPSTGVAAAVFLLLGVALSRFTLAGRGVHVDAPAALALDLGLLSLAGVFVVTVLAARTVLRDRETGMDELVESTPFPGRRRFLHLLAGTALAALAVLAAAVAAMAAVHALGLSGAESSGGFHPARYLAPFGLIVVPAVLVTVAFLAWVARATGSAAAVYLAGVGLYLAYFGLSIVGGSPLIAGGASAGGAVSAAAGLLDPFGLVPLLEGTRTWTVQQMNALPVAGDGALLANRGLWLAAALGFALLAAGRSGRILLSRRPLELEFKRGRRERARSRGEEASPAAVGGPSERSAVRSPELPSVPPSSGGWRPALAAAVSEARARTAVHLRGLPMVIAAVLWVAVAATGLVEIVGDGPFDTPFRPLTGLIVAGLLGSFRLPGVLVVIFFAAELAWADRTSRMHPLADATPVADGTRFAASVLAVAGLSLLLVVLLQLPAAGYQLLAGGTPDPGLYASLFYLLGAPWLLIGVLTVAIQAFSPGKYAGMLIAAVAVVLWRPLASSLLGLDGPLFHFASAPELDHSAFVGLGPVLGAFHGHMIYWALATLAAATAAAAAARRGVDEGIRPRIRRLVAPGRRPGLVVTAVATAAFLGTGAWIHARAADGTGFADEASERRWRAAYERRLAGLAGLETPVVAGTELELDLRPDRRSYELSGRYRLVNRGEAPVDSLLVGWRRPVAEGQLEVEGAGEIASYPDLDHRLFRLDPPLAAGEGTTVRFETTVEQGTFSPYDPDHAVLADGTFLRLERFLPWPGYAPLAQLEEPAIRRAHGLDPSPADAPPTPGTTRHDRRAPYRLVVSTAPDQRIAASGQLRRTWRADGRRHSLFASDGPMRLRYAVASARWRREVVEHAGGRIELLHHPAHGRILPMLREAARSSMEILSELYGSPGRGSVSVAEIPSYRSEGVEATAYPGVVFVREHGGWTGDFEDLAPDRPRYFARRVAHELAHQWWGDRLSPARTVPGAAVLTEAVAEWSAALVVRRTRGEAAFRALMRREEERYLRYRGRAGPETPLAAATGSTDYVAYFRGPVVLNAVAETAGEGAVVAALRELLDRERDRPAVTTVEDLIEGLAERLPAERRPLLEAWFRETGTVDLRVREAATRRLADGRWEVTAEVILERRGGDPEDRPPTTVSEPVTVEVTGAADGDALVGAVLTSRTVELRPGRQSVRLVVGDRPARVELDPTVTRLDPDRANNVAELAPAARGSVR